MNTDTATSGNETDPGAEGENQGAGASAAAGGQASPPKDDPPAGGETDATEGSEDAGQDTFTREYVTGLRQESARYRTRANELAETLWRERVAALGLLADPTDLPYDQAALDDPEAIRAAADELLARKPHLRTRRITERAGQGEGSAGETVSLTGIMRARA